MCGTLPLSTVKISNQRVGMLGFPRACCWGISLCPVPLPTTALGGGKSKVRSHRDVPSCLGRSESARLDVAFSERLFQGLAYLISLVCS